jgi:hypothetical protein
MCRFDSKFLVGSGVGNKQKQMNYFLPVIQGAGQSFSALCMLRLKSSYVSLAPNTIQPP